MKRLKTIGDSEFGWLRDILELETTPEQDLACLKLEEMGYRFCVDYGYQNAQVKLEQAYEERLNQLDDAGVLQ